MVAGDHHGPLVAREPPLPGDHGPAGGHVLFQLAAPVGEHVVWSRAEGVRGTQPDAAGRGHARRDAADPRFEERRGQDRPDHRPACRDPARLHRGRAPRPGKQRLRVLQLRRGQANQPGDRIHAVPRLPGRFRHPPLHRRSPPPLAARAAAAQAAIDLYGPDDPAVPFADRAAEVATEIRLLQAIKTELAAHAAAREAACRSVDAGQIAGTLPGLAEVGGPAMTAIMGKPGLFLGGHHFMSFLGLAPRASETGETDRKGEPMTKAGPSLGRATMIRAADTARKLDPQLARISCTQMTERGASHLKACCVVAGHLALRLDAAMLRGAPYQLRDTDGAPVTPAQARQIIAAHGIPVTRQKKAVVTDREPVPATGREELTTRLLKGLCEWCEHRAPVEIHQVGRLADLAARPGRPQPGWAHLMATMRRKTLVVCTSCHKAIHAGQLTAASPQ